MFTKTIAWILSFLSFFAFWSPNAQPNNIPETRTYVGEVPDKYGIWPTEEFDTSPGPWWLRGLALDLVVELYKLRTGTDTSNDSLLILHKGKLVCERYANGWDQDTPHYMASVTKSVTSALVGVAIGDGLITGVDQKVLEFFPEAIGLPGWEESKRDMTVEHLLTMTSGILSESDEDWDGFFAEDQEDSALYAFLRPQKAKPGEKFAYENIAPSILLGIIDRKTGDVLKYAREKLFGPLGMSSVEWDTAADGLPYAGWGLFLTPRDMAKFGYLYLNEGCWEGVQLVPAQWVADSAPRSKRLMGYGYLWWTAMLSPLSSACEARGYYGQFITVHPKKDLVIVRTGSPGRLALALNSLLIRLGIFPDDTGGEWDRFWPENPISL